MSKKFTEEQYQKIIEKWDGEISYIEATKAVVGYIAVEDLGYSISNQALSLANPLTREWAHEQFVEKEKLYVWHSKKINNHGKSIRLFKYTNQSIGSFLANRSDKVTEDEHLTESEIKAWGYNPEMFDKEEVY